MAERNPKIIRNYEAAALKAGIDRDDATALRRAAIDLHRWSELECGDGNAYASWAIERDDDTGKPYLRRYVHDETMIEPIADKEAGALKRVAKIAKVYGLTVEHQTDPRGWPLNLTTPDGKTLSVPPYSY